MMVMRSNLTSAVLPRICKLDRGRMLSQSFRGRPSSSTPEQLALDRRPASTSLLLSNPSSPLPLQPLYNANTTFVPISAPSSPRVGGVPHLAYPDAQSQGVRHKPVPTCKSLCVFVCMRPPLQSQTINSKSEFELPSEVLYNSLSSLAK